MSVQEPLDTNQNLNAENVMESLGEPPEAAQQLDNAGTLNGTSNNTVTPTDPLYVQKRLKQQSRQHEREMREMQAQMAQMHSQMANNNPQPAINGDMNSNVGNGSSDDVIQKAVNFALSQRDLAERKQKEAENAQYMQKQYKGLQSHLDSMGDKYDDFHEKVFSDELPITNTMRDYAMTLPRKGAGSAGEVIYHLANHPEELKRISKLHPIDQAAEMSKLSHALISGGENKAIQSQSRPPLGNIKSMPLSNSAGVNDKTPVSSIRARMKVRRLEIIRGRVPLATSGIFGE